MSRWAARWPPELLLLLAIAVVAVSAAPLNTDTAYGMVAARRLLGGAHLYVDLFETNPPLIFWIFAIPAYTGRWLALSDARLVGLLVASLLTISGLAVFRLFALDPDSSRIRRDLLFTVFLAAVVVPYFTWTGQREQIAAILAFPYCVLATRAARAEGTPRMLSVFCGLLSGIGFAIKPFFLLTWLTVECAVIVARGWRQAIRLDSAVIAVVQIAYALAVLVVTPDYVTRTVPIALALYSDYGSQLMAGMRSGRFIGLSVVAITATTSLFWRDPAGGVRESAIWGAVTLGWLLAFVVQRKGWPYHLIPAFVYGSVCACIGLLESLRAASASTSERGRFLAVASAIPLVGVLAWAAPWVPATLRDVSRGLDGPRETEVAMADMVGRLAGGGPIYFLSTSMWPGFPVVNMTHTQWPYRYHFMWPIPALYKGRRTVEPAYRSPDEQQPLERQFFDAVIDDMVRVPPKVLVVDARSRLAAMNGRRFDFVRYFSSSDRFRALFLRYQSIGWVGPWEVYERR